MKVDDKYFLQNDKAKMFKLKEDVTIGPSQGKIEGISVEQQLKERHLKERHLKERHLKARHLKERHLKERHLKEGVGLQRKFK